MEFIQSILHLDEYLATIAVTYHNYIYLILFIVIFCETGLVVTPVLPGDSLLFIAGGIAALGQLNITILTVVILTATICGDNCNFFVGKFLGEKLFKNPKSKIFRRDILNKTHAYYNKHGSKTIILARFIPLIRTFAPFVAGLGYMPYHKFISMSIIAALLWVGTMLGGGYLFGDVPFIKQHLSLVIMGILVISVIPLLKIVITAIYKRYKNTV